MQSARHEIPDEDLTDIQYMVAEVNSEMQSEDLLVLTDLEDDPESIARIGRWGEEYVYNVLRRRNCLPNGLKITGIDWVNEITESGSPYDIEVTLERQEGMEATGEDGDKVYIEVKSTASSSKDLVAFSWNELKFAEEKKDSYQLYRVYHAGTQTPRLRQLENINHYLLVKGTRLFFLL
jgi:hypothetical protein